MDFNVCVVHGRLAAPPELRELEAGGRMLRLLVTVRSEQPVRRVDVLPVQLWNPDVVADTAIGAPGTEIWAAASLQRRFSSGSEGRRSRIEIVASQVQVGSDPPTVINPIRRAIQPD